MRRLASALCLFIALTRAATGQDHLIPDTDVLAHPDDYKPKLRLLLNEAFARDVDLRVIVIPGREPPGSLPEYAVGLKTTHGEPVGPSESEIFVLKLSSSLDDSLRLEATEERLRSGEEMSKEEEEIYRMLKARAPADFRQIKAVRSSRAVPAKQAEAISGLWRKELLDVRHPEEDSGFVIHGDFYYFSAEFSWRGTLSGHVQTPIPETRTARLVALIETMADYARGQSDLEILEERIEAAKKL